MNHLLRAAAPISELGWELLDGEARQRLTPALAARRLVDVSDPEGWTRSAVGLGRSSTVSPPPAEGVTARRRLVLPLVELRADFAVSREELGDADRGAPDVDLADLDRAARRLAAAENAAVFAGWQGSLRGIAEAATLDPVGLGSAAAGYPERLAEAVELLLAQGIAGPYALALGPQQYRAALGGDEGGYPLLEHLRQILDGPIVWAPGIDGGVLVSRRGGDFALELGQDVSIGYEDHDRENVRLYLEESFAFHVNTPEAAVILAAQEGRAGEA